MARATQGEDRFSVTWSPSASRHSGANGTVQISLTDKTSSSREQTSYDVALAMRELRGLNSCLPDEFSDPEHRSSPPFKTRSIGVLSL